MDGYSDGLHNLMTQDYIDQWHHPLPQSQPQAQQYPHDWSGRSFNNSNTFLSSPFPFEEHTNCFDDHIEQSNPYYFPNFSTTIDPHPCFDTNCQDTIVCGEPQPCPGGIDSCGDTIACGPTEPCPDGAACDQVQPCPDGMGCQVQFPHSTGSIYPSPSNIPMNDFIHDPPCPEGCVAPSQVFRSGSHVVCCTKSHCEVGPTKEMEQNIKPDMVKKARRAHKHAHRQRAPTISNHTPARETFNESEPKYRCRFVDSKGVQCSLATNDRPNMCRHLDRHYANRFECALCGGLQAKRGNLKRHLMSNCKVAAEMFKNEIASADDRWCVEFIIEQEKCEARKELEAAVFAGYTTSSGAELDSP